jgi:hypothetical protein
MIAGKELAEQLKKINEEMDLMSKIQLSTFNLKINQAIVIYVAGKKTNAKVKAISAKENVIDATANNKTYFCTKKNNKWIAQVN